MYKLLAVLLICCLVACDDKIDEVKILEVEVMSIHDEVMPKISDIHKAKRQLQTALEGGADSSKVFSLIRNLDNADEGMMIWMNEYKTLEDGVKKEVKISYLEDEKEKINFVKDQMEASLSAVFDFVNQ